MFDTAEIPTPTAMIPPTLNQVAGWVDGARIGDVFVYSQQQTGDMNSREVFAFARKLHDSGIARCHIRSRADHMGSEHILVKRNPAKPMPKSLA